MLTSDKLLSLSELWLRQLEIWCFNATFPDFSNGFQSEDIVPHMVLSEVHVFVVAVAFFKKSSQ